MSLKVYVSPSSQEANTYVGGDNEERVMNLLADILIPDLVRHGITVMRNKKGNTYNGHVAESNVYKPDLHLALHSNAMGGTQTGTARGCEVFCYDPTNAASIGTQLAQKIYSRLSGATMTADRGVKSGRTGISEIANTNAPSVLIEVAFHDNADDAKWILSHLYDIEFCILMAVLDQFGIKYIPMTTPLTDKKLEDTINALMEKLEWYEQKLQSIRKIVDAPFVSTLFPN